MSDDKKLSDKFVLFIDLLYAVVVGVSLKKISDYLGIPLKFSNIWYSDKNLSAFFLFVLSFLIVGRDWIAYHIEVLKTYHRNTKLGITRFIIDILILISFFLMVSSYDLPNKFFYISGAYFSFVLLWTICGYFEHRNLKKNNVEKKAFKKEFWKDIFWDSGLIVVFILIGFRISSIRLSQLSVISFILIIYIIITIRRGLPKL